VGNDVGDSASTMELSAALEDVVRRFGNFMRRTAHRHNLGAGEIDEVMQDTRIRLWKALGTSDSIQQAPASYIYRTVTSAALDFLRRRRARREDSLDETGEFTPTPVTASRSADQTQQEGEIEHVVAQSVELLVESRRAVVRMYLAGFDREEIQQLLGWSEAKTRNLLYRGLADLRATLQARGYGPGGSQ
jgi:RNA polymerase sigma-70 factor (ECF subfamily)